MRSAILTTLMLGALGCIAGPSARQRLPSPLTRADSARITTAFLGGGAANSAGYVTLRQFFARHDSLEAARTAPRRYASLRVF
jgi:hypothetical protein